MTMNYLEKITEIYAFVSVDEGGEGIIAQTMTLPIGEVFIPFVSADKEKLKLLKPMAIQIQKESNKKIRLIKFTNVEEIEVFE
jgi:hypothetical protein